MYNKVFKRVLDILISLTALLLLSPVLLVLFVLVRVKLGSPAVFTQERPGKDEKIFKLYKFRSMTEERDSEGALLPDEQRLTRFGRTLRATSLDELPELFNILKGDMSLVGPRPLLVRYLPYYTEEERKRHSVRPGLTGYAQVNGRNCLGWEERFKYDVEYAEHVTFRMDLHILCKTVVKVVKRSDILSGAEQVTEDFDQYRQKQEKQGALPYFGEF